MREKLLGPDSPLAAQSMNDLANVYRDDIVVPPLGTEAALAQAPASAQDRFRVPRILTDQA